MILVCCLSAAFIVLLPHIDRVSNPLQRQNQLRAQGWTESTSNELNQIGSVIQIAMKQQHAALAAAQGTV